MSEFKTILIDPVTITSSSARWVIPSGIKYKSKRIRLVDVVPKFIDEHGNPQPYYFGNAGIYSIIRKISIVDEAGCEIDRIFQDGIQFLAMQNLLLDNASQYGISRLMTQNMPTSVWTPSLSQITSTEEQDVLSATALSALIDVSLTLDYLKQHSVLSQSLQVLVEFNLPEGVTLQKPPVLAYDEMLDASIKADDGGVFTTIIQDRLVLPAGNPLTQTKTSISTRLNSYYNQYIKTLYYSNILVDPKNPLNLGYARCGEKFQLQIDGKKILPLGGVASPAMKQHMLTETFGDACTPTGSNQLLDVPLHLRLPNVVSGYGLVELDGRLSYGAVSLERFVQGDVTLEYETTDVAPVTTYLVVLAQVLRSYDPVKHKVSTVMASA